MSTNAKFNDFSADAGGFAAGFGGQTLANGTAQTLAVEGLTGFGYAAFSALGQGGAPSGALATTFADVDGGSILISSTLNWGVSALNSSAAGSISQESGLAVFGSPLTTGVGNSYVPPSPGGLAPAGNLANLDLGSVAVGGNSSSGVWGTTLAVQDAFSTVAGTSHALIG